MCPTACDPLNEFLTILPELTTGLHFAAAVLGSIAAAVLLAFRIRQWRRGR